MRCISFPGWGKVCSADRAMSQIVTTRRGKIVCIGDLLVDVWWRVDTAKRNVEHAAVALTSNPSECQIQAGGAGLFAATAELAGFDVALFSVADTQTATLNALSKLSKTVDTANVQLIRDFHTPTKTRYINKNGHILVRHDSETTEQPAHNNPPPAALGSALAARPTCLVVSDYNKQCFCRTALVEIADAYGVPIFVDAKPQHVREYAGADMFKLNRAELEGIVGDHLDFAAALRAAAAILATPLLIVTDGARGVGWCLRGQTGFLASPKRYSAGNCVGAGDVFFAGLLLGFSEIGHFDCRTLTGERLTQALKIALAAAGQRVRANGRKPFNPQKILREVNKNAQPQQKIMAAAELAKFAAAKHAQGKQVVFTNGCFDLMHAGHVHLLTYAKQQGDVLIVAVDADANVRQLKGEGRPVQDQTTRAGNIAALASVDAVCVFEETTPQDATGLRALIESVNPHILIKGADYINKQVVGAEIVERNSGHVIFCPLLPNSSTTALVNKIRATTP